MRSELGDSKSLDFRKESHYGKYNHACLFSKLANHQLVACNKLANHTAFSG